LTDARIHVWATAKRTSIHGAKLVPFLETPARQTLLKLEGRLVGEVWKID